MPNQAPVHWSKDFVEHLRTVHLALIATAAALVVIALATKPYSTAAAGNQIRQIQDLRSHWSPEFVRNLKNQTYANPPDRETLVLKKGGYSVFPVQPPVKTLYVKVGLSVVPNPEVYLIHLPEQYWTFLFRPDPRQELFSLKETPDTMSGFRDWWNELRIETCHVYFPTNVSFGDIHKNLPPDFQSFEDKPSEPLEVFYPAQVSKGKPAITGEANLVLTRIYDEEQDVTYEGLTDAPSRNGLIVRARDWTRTDVNTELLASYLALRDGAFEQLFRDLDEYSKANGIQSLKGLEETLSKSDSSESPVFEAFGMKFPADLATLGGTIVLLSVQLYFFVYLRKLYGSLNEHDPGWDVPWVGMDSSGLAILIFLITVVLFPIFSLLLLSEKATVRLTRGYWDHVGHPFHLISVLEWHWTVQLKIVALFIALISSAFLGRLSWKYRPQIAPEPPTPPSCPAQLFE